MSHAAATHADRAGIRRTNGTAHEPSWACFSNCKAQYVEAEPLMRRALAIDEQSYGKEHPERRQRPQ